MCYETFQIKRNKSFDVATLIIQKKTLIWLQSAAYSYPITSQALSHGNNQDVEMGISSFSGICYMRLVHTDKHFVTLTATLQSTAWRYIHHSCICHPIDGHQNCCPQELWEQCSRMRKSTHHSRTRAKLTLEYVMSSGLLWCRSCMSATSLDSVTLSQKVPL